MASIANQSEPLRVLVESTRSGLWILCCRLCISILNRKLKKTGIFLDKVIWKSSVSHIVLILKESCLSFPSFQIRMSGQGSIEYEVIISQNFYVFKPRIKEQEIAIDVSKACTTQAWCLLVKLIQSLYFEILPSYRIINKYGEFVEEQIGYMHNGVSLDKGRSDAFIQTFDLNLSFKVEYCYSIVLARSSQSLEIPFPLYSASA